MIALEADKGAFSAPSPAPKGTADFASFLFNLVNPLPTDPISYTSVGVSVVAAEVSTQESFP